MKELLIVQSLLFSNFRLPIKKLPSWVSALIPSPIEYSTLYIFYDDSPKYELIAFASGCLDSNSIFPIAFLIESEIGISVYSFVT